MFRMLVVMVGFFFLLWLLYLRSALAGNKVQIISPKMERCFPMKPQKLFSSLECSTQKSVKVQTNNSS